MKAITLKQPWADLIVYGGKNVENRTWGTDYRGPLALVAGMGVDAEAVNGLQLVGQVFASRCVVGVVDLVDVHEHGEDGCGDRCLLWSEFCPFGLRTIKHWVLENPRPVPSGHVFEYTGFLGIRDLGAPIEAALLAVLAVRS
jgi:hypothetical protein